MEGGIYMTAVLSLQNLESEKISPLGWSTLSIYCNKDRA